MGVFATGNMFFEKFKVFPYLTSALDFSFREFDSVYSALSDYAGGVEMDCVSAPCVEPEDIFTRTIDFTFSFDFIVNGIYSGAVREKCAVDAA